MHAPFSMDQSLLVVQNSLTRERKEDSDEEEVVVGGGGGEEEGKGEGEAGDDDDREESYEDTFGWCLLESIVDTPCVPSRSENCTENICNRMSGKEQHGRGCWVIWSTALILIRPHR